MSTVQWGRTDFIEISLIVGREEYFESLTVYHKTDVN